MKMLSPIRAFARTDVAAVQVCPRISLSTMSGLLLNVQTRVRGSNGFPRPRE